MTGSLFGDVCGVRRTAEVLRPQLTLKQGIHASSAAALQREEGAEGTRLISLGVTHASAKPAAEDGRTEG